MDTTNYDMEATSSLSSSLNYDHERAEEEEEEEVEEEEDREIKKYLYNNKTLNEIIEEGLNFDIFKNCIRKSLFFKINPKLFGR